jgi:hypothetical protein
MMRALVGTKAIIETNRIHYGDDADLIIVPGIDFNSNKTSARQGKEGEEHSLDKIGEENFVHAKSGRRWSQKRIT